MAIYTYSISNDFSNGVTPEKLRSEIIDNSNLSSKFDFIHTKKDDCNIHFTSTLTSTENSELDTIVSNHDGDYTINQLIIGTKIVYDEKSITNTTEWQNLGNILSDLNFFIPDLTNTYGRFLGEIKTDGTDVELRVIEENPDDGTIKELVSSYYVADDTSNDWKPIKMYTDIAPDGGGYRLYKLQGRLNTSNSAAVRDLTLGMLNDITLPGIT